MYLQILKNFNSDILNYCSEIFILKAIASGNFILKDCSIHIEIKIEQNVLIMLMYDTF